MPRGNDPTTVRRRLIVSAYGNLVAELYWKLRIDPVLCVDALEPALGFRDPVGRVASMWAAYNGSPDNFPGFVRHHADGLLGSCKERRDV